MKKAAVLLAILLAGCSAMKTETVYLRKGDSLVTCGPYEPKLSDETGMDAERRLRDCVSDFHRQGYNRVPPPSN